MPGSNSRPNVSEGYEVPLSYRGDRLTCTTTTVLLLWSTTTYYCKQNENSFSLSSVSENLVTRNGFLLAVPSRVSPLRLNLVLTREIHSPRFPWRRPTILETAMGSICAHRWRCLPPKVRRLKAGSPQSRYDSSSNNDGCCLLRKPSGPILCVPLFFHTH